jgi:crotonobetainyl-CoA:carnitine CoA-transferase CaiB-like acyl-CoA transferase
MTDAEYPLGDLRVLDLSTGIAGGYCTRLLADLGADVVKLEPPGGDPLRGWSASGTPIAAGQSGALFRFLHTSKRSAIADLTSAPGRERALGLVPGCELVVESAGPGAIDSLGLGIDELQRVRADVSLVSISPFGRGGPLSQRAANEFTLLGWCGSMSMRGTPDGPPVAVGGRTGEWMAGLNAAVGALLALWRARRSGRGEHVDVSMLETMTTAHVNFLALAASLDGEGPAPLPVPRFLEVPCIEPAADGWIGFATNSAAQFAAFCGLVGHPEWAGDPRYSRWDQRPLHHAELRRAIAEALRGRKLADLLEDASARRIPVAPVGNGRDTPRFALCAERGMFVENPDGDFIQPRVPWRFSGARTRALSPAPRLGQDAQAEPPLRTPAPVRGSADALRLAGLRVIDFTSYWAGPLAAEVFALMGADVIKLESIQSPDGTRMSTAYKAVGDRPWERQPLYYGNNGSKRSLTLDLKSEDGRRILGELVRRSDLLIENYSPRVLEGAGFGWERVRELNPRLVMLRMPAWGLDGSWRDRTAFAHTMEQFTGMAWLTGDPGGPPVCPRGPCDPIAGMHGALCALAALEQRERTGLGQLVAVPMVETALNAAAEQFVEYSATGVLLERQGNRGPWAAPQGIYACAPPRAPEFERAPDVRLPEHWVALACESDAQWRALCTWLGLPEWSRAPGLATHSGRRAAHDQLDRELARAFASRAQDELVEGLGSAGVPIAPVAHGRAVDENPQMRARGFFAPIEHPVSGRHEVPGLPMTFSSRAGGWHRGHPPLLGQHNDEILAELGIGPEERARLRREGVIGERPLKPGGSPPPA